jgi:dihydrodipicolinate synthase/N-acetylneuraminate lyase
MNRHSIDWAGPMPAVTTPFHADLSMDEEGFVANIKRLLNAGATGIVAAGCTGEFWALSLAERERLAELTVAACKGARPAIVGTGAIREGEVIEQIDAAKSAGADAVLVMPAYFAHLSDIEIIEHFAAIDAKSTLPIVLYNIPGNAGNAITPAIADKLADLDNVVAIKESSGAWQNFHLTLECGERSYPRVLRTIVHHWRCCGAGWCGWPYRLLPQCLGRAACSFGTKPKLARWMKHGLCRQLASDDRAVHL